MQDAVIVDAVRSPMGRGKQGGVLSQLHPVELLAQTLRGLLARSDIDPAEVDDFIVGCVMQVGEQSAGVGRMAWLAAGLPVEVPASTVERKCGSSQQAVHFAAQGIQAGAYDIVVVAGVESMSRIPMGTSALGADPIGPSVTARFAPGLVSQGIAAELVAAKWNLGRLELDEYAAASQQRAAECAERGDFSSEIVPIHASLDGRDTVVVDDETIRPATTVEGLSKLPAVFADDEAGRRFPEISWAVTAGNSSQLADGASAMLLMSASRAAQLNLRPRARVHATAVVGDDPILMLAGPIAATEKVLDRGGLTVARLDHVEVNEAFASVPLAWQREFDMNPYLLNPRGGAIALGHPLGASGCRLATTMINALEATGGRYGLQSMCEAGGMANAMIIERI